jgi:hypothetical protein
MTDDQTGASPIAHGKYYLEADRVLGGAEVAAAGDDAVSFSDVIDPARVHVSSRPVAPSWGATPTADEIRVDVVREQGRARGIRISCPCGRHAELDVEYPAGSVST